MSAPRGWWKMHRNAHGTRYIPRFDRLHLVFCVLPELSVRCGLRVVGTTVQAIQMPQDVADDIAVALRDADGQIERERCETKHRLDQGRRAVLAKVDRGYDDFVSDRIS